jgi:hypothetical protein
VHVDELRAGRRENCTGELYDMRETGVTLGDRDLNHVSDGEFDYVKSKCGEPWSIGDDSTPKKCSIKVLASSTRLRVQDPPAFASVTYYYRVFKVLGTK